MSELRKSRLRALAEIDLYPVTGQEFSRGRSSLQIIEAVREAGCKIVQLREKGLSKRVLYEVAKQAREITSDMLLICNDHLDIALSVGADGVHLGQDDFPVDAARRLAPDLIIGASSHNLQQALEAQRLGADYVNLGPVFATNTKTLGAAPLGVDLVREIAGHLTVPYTVMGGIGLKNLDDLLSVGAGRVAVVTAVTQASDPQKAAYELRARICSNHPKVL